MAKTFAVLKMIQDGDERGRPDIEQEVSFVHLSSDGLPDGYMAYKLSGPDAVIAAVEANAKCMAAERIGEAIDTGMTVDGKNVENVIYEQPDKDGYTLSTAIGLKPVAVASRAKVDAYLAKQKKAERVDEDTLIDVVRKFEPLIDRNWGSDIEDKYAA